MKNGCFIGLLILALSLTFIGCDPESADQKSVFVPEVQEQVDQLGLSNQEVYIMDEEGQTFTVTGDGQLVTSGIACPGARCCKYTYTIGGVQKIKYYSFPVCPDNPAFQDVGPCPVCPP